MLGIIKIQKSFSINYEFKKRSGFVPFWFFTFERYNFKAKQKFLNLLNYIKERNERNKSVLNSMKLSDIVKSKYLRLKWEQILFAHDRCFNVKTIATTATTPTTTQMPMVMLKKKSKHLKNIEL